MNGLINGYILFWGLEAKLALRTEWFSFRNAVPMESSEDGFYVVLCKLLP